MKNNWQTKKLGEICDVNPTKSEVRNFSDDLEISFVQMSSVDEFLQSIIFEETKKLGVVKKGFTYFKKGDILFAKITPCMENGKVALSTNLKKEIGFGSTEFHVLRARNELVLPDYIYYLVRSKVFREEAEQSMTGSAGQKRVPKDFLINYEISLPPLKTQKEIVAKLDAKFAKLREAKRLREEALVGTEKILSQTLREIFEEGRENGWEEKTIGDMCIKITDGSHNPPTKEGVGEYIMLSSRNIYDGYVTFDHPRYLTKAGFESENKRTDIKIGDVLLTIVGTIGRCSVVDFEKPKFTVQRSVAVLKPNNKLNSFYLSYWLRGPFVQDFLLVNARGAAQKGFYLKDIKALKILVPSIFEQQKIVAKLDKLSEKIRTLCDLQTSQLADLKRLEKSYLHEAFNGELI